MTFEKGDVKQQLFDCARKYFHEEYKARTEKPFIGGETYIPASGKVLDEDDLISPFRCLIGFMAYGGQICG